MTERIDAHQHLWQYTPDEYRWIDESMHRLRRDFLVHDLNDELRNAGVHGTVAVQARQSQAETDWLLALAEQPESPILGVVGWLPLESPGIAGLLASYKGNAKLKGLRHGVQDEPAGFLDGGDFNGGIRAMSGTGLRYDLLIRSWQMEEAIHFVDRHPNQLFILDHLGKPAIRSAEIQDWSRCMRELAMRPHVACKLSGLVTEADPQHWTPQQLQPYAQVALEAFGARRVMVGSDWPVLTLGCGYVQWWQIVEGWVCELSADEQAAILGGTAQHWYGLDEHTSQEERQ